MQKLCDVRLQAGICLSYTNSCFCFPTSVGRFLSRQGWAGLDLFWQTQYSCCVYRCCVVTAYRQSVCCDLSLHVHVKSAISASPIKFCSCLFPALLSGHSIDSVRHVHSLHNLNLETEPVARLVSPLNMAQIFLDEIRWHLKNSKIATVRIRPSLLLLHNLQAKNINCVNIIFDHVK